MKPIRIVLSGPTHAIKLKRLLTREDIAAKLVRVGIEGVGCSHAVEIKYEDLFSAIAIMRSVNMPYSIERKI